MPTNGFSLKFLGDLNDGLFHRISQPPQQKLEMKSISLIFVSVLILGPVSGGYAVSLFPQANRLS